MTGEHKKLVLEHLRRTAENISLLAGSSSDRIVEAAGLMIGTLSGGGCVFFCGNGGSAADCQHLAAELVVRLTPRFAGRSALPALALTTDSSVLTACANDLGFEFVFSRQVEALGRENDLLVVISTSGRSANLVEAARAARGKKMKVLGLLGGDGGRVGGMCDSAVMAPGSETHHVQECHIAVGHILCDLVERELFDKG